jgi:chemotaxis-related protein WspD
MSDRLDGSALPVQRILNDCWNRIGVRGDQSCPLLPLHVHCRNCPVYADGAAEMLDATAPAAYLTEWTAHFAQPKRAAAGEMRSVVIFRVSGEWLALPTSAVMEVANVLPIHSLPHRQSSAVLGLASVRGQLLVCVSLGQILAVNTPPRPPGENRGKTYQRLLVIRHEDVHVVCPVDEVHGVYPFDPATLKGVPATVAGASVTYSTAVLSWRGQQVGILDAAVLFDTVRRSLR